MRCKKNKLTFFLFTVLIQTCGQRLQLESHKRMAMRLIDDKQFSECITL